MCGAVLTCIAGDRARRCEAAAQLSSNSSWPALRDCATRESVPGQTCRTPRGSSRGRDSPRSIGRRQSGSPAASWHWYCKHLCGCCQSLLHWTSSASGDVCSPMIRIEYNEDAFTSCSIGLDHPGTKLHKSVLLEELVVRLVVHHLEQQRQLKFVMSRRRGRRRPVPMHHQRVLDVQSSSSTAGRQNTNGSAHCRKHISEDKVRVRRMWSLLFPKSFVERAPRACGCAPVTRLRRKRFAKKNAV